MTRARRLSPRAHLALQYLIMNFFRNVVSVRLVKSIYMLPPVTYAGSCTLVRYDNDVDPGFHYYEADGTALNIRDILGSAQSGNIQCLKSTKP
eukprot:6588668-Pyramimonas_sp.AAC.1